MYKSLFALKTRFSLWLIFNLFFKIFGGGSKFENSSCAPRRAREMGEESSRAPRRAGETGKNHPALLAERGKKNIRLSNLQYAYEIKVNLVNFIL